MQNTAEILEFPNETIVSHLGIEIDLAKDNKLTEQARKLLMEYYCREDETSPQYAYDDYASLPDFDTWYHFIYLDL